MHSKIDKKIFEPNSLNTIRLIAAFEVMYGHTIAHLNINVPLLLDYIVQFFKGVPIFFTLSGFLIWMSIGRSKSFKQYCKKRFWRIFPELWIAVLIEIIVLLYLYDHVIEWDKLGLFAVAQSTIFQFWTPDFLRDYGCGTPNGSLWTICVLIQFYLVAFFTYRLLKNKNKKIWFIAFIFFVLISSFTTFLCRILPDVLGKLYGQSFIPYFWMFLFGAFVSEYSEKILPILKKYWIVVFFLTLLITITKFDLTHVPYGLFKTISLFLFLLGFAYSVPQINIEKDISYSVYIYHMTVVNAMISLGYMDKPIFLIVVTIITFFVSYISTISVGNWSIKIKKKMT